MNDLTTAEGCITHLALLDIGRDNLMTSVTRMKKSLGETTSCEGCTDRSALAEAILDAVDRVKAQFPTCLDAHLKHDATILCDHFVDFAEKLVA